MKDKTILIILVIVLALIVLPNLGLFTVFDTQENLGRWSISSYNPSTKEITIPISLQAHSDGSFGVQNMHQLGTSIITNQQNCEEIGWSWRTTGIPYNGYPCYLNNPNWFDDKTYTHYIICTSTKPGSTVTGQYIPEDRPSWEPPLFNGFSIWFPNLKRSLDDVVTCQGKIIVKPKGECVLADDCEGKPHIAVPGQWECLNNNCVWVQEIQENITCDEFCQNLTPEPCIGIGSWGYSGVYPECGCEYTCEEENQTIIYFYQNYTIETTKIIYIYQDCKDIGCPTDYECQADGVCIKEEEMIKWYNQEIFLLGDFQVKLWMLGIAILFLLLLIPRRR